MMTNEEKTIRDLDQLLTEALDVAETALKHSKKSFLTGIYLGVSVAYLTVVIAKWYYS